MWFRSIRNPELVGYIFLTDQDFPKVGSVTRSDFFRGRMRPYQIKTDRICQNCGSATLKNAFPDIFSNNALADMRTSRILTD
jgi:hypothetical protein